MRNCCDRSSASSRRQNTALFTRKNSAASGLTEISANQKSRDLRRTMAFASAFIVTAYAPFSIKSLASAMKNSLFRITLNYQLERPRRDGQSSARRGPMHYLRAALAKRELQAMHPNQWSAKLVNDYRLEEADAISGSIRASGFTMSSASLFSSSFASDSSSKVCCRSSADLSCPSSCAKVRTLP